MTRNLSIIPLIALAGCVAVQTAHAAPGCTSRDFAGSYGMLATGNILFVPAPVIPTGPFARVGRVVSDGKGNIAVDNTASYDGLIITEAYAGTYTVSADCSLDVNVVVPLPGLGPVPFEFVGALSNGGNDAAVVVCGIGAPCSAGAPTGAVLRVLLARQDDNQVACTLKDLSGGFQIDMSGNVITSSGPAPFARDGVLTFDGRGGFGGHAVVNPSGLPAVAETLNGVYSVDSHCEVSIGYTLGGSHLWTGMLTKQGNGADLIVKENGVVISGTLTSVDPGNGHD